MADILEVNKIDIEQFLKCLELKKNFVIDKQLEWHKSCFLSFFFLFENTTYHEWNPSTDLEMSM